MSDFNELPPTIVRSDEQHLDKYRTVVSVMQLISATTHLKVNADCVAKLVS